MGWLDNIFGGLSMPDYDKMLKERLEKEQREEDEIFDMSKNVDQINEKIKDDAIEFKVAEKAEREKEVEEEKEEEEKAADELKLVIDGAKLKCDMCTNPVGDLKVNFKTPTLQGKKTATVKEKDMKSLIFKGNCTKSPQSSSPCASVMQLGEWKDVGTLKVQDEFPLLLKSTIKCNFGGSDIKITDCGQINEPSDIDATPKEAKKEKQILDVKWMCADMKQEIKNAGVGDKVSLFVKTKNYEEGETVSVKVKEKEGQDIKTGEKEVTFEGTVAKDGTAELKEKVEIENVEEEPKEAEAT